MKQSQRSSSPRMNKALMLALVILAAIITYHYLGLSKYFTLDWLKGNSQALLHHSQENFPLYASAYFFIYIIVTGLSLPGAAVMTLAGGYLFGVIKGTLLVSFASTFGACLAFLAARFVLRDWVEKKFRTRMDSIKKGIEKEGKMYLFSLRLIPIFPFFLINLVMGLTPMRLSSFYWVSQLGMLPGTIAYVNAGRSLATIDSLRSVLSPTVILSFTLLGIFPILANIGFGIFKRKRLYRKFPHPKKFDFNLIVIGAGAGGLVASYIAAIVKAKVALIEKDKMGGDCLNTGCVPSKALIRSAQVAHTARNASEYGVNVSTPEIDFPKVMERIRQVIGKIEPNDSPERYTELGVDCIKGDPKILTPYEVEINGKKITTRNIIISTGAGPFIPDIPGIKNVSVFTSDTLWNLNELPKRLLILGAGPIGCEMAQAFKRLGSHVTMIERASRVLRVEDEDVSDFLLKRLRSEGIEILLDTTAKEFKRDGDKQLLLCQDEHGSKEITFDHCLLSLGRRANTKGLGLEDLKVEISERGTIAHNPYMQTNYPNIYVCGDVAGPFQFTHVASHQAWYASVNSLFSPLARFKADYRVIPWCTFVDPEIARVGLSEQEAQARGITYDVTLFPLDDLDRAVADSQNSGFVKILSVKGKDKILGACIVGARAADMIAEFSLAMKHGIGLNKILSTVHLYPSFSEALKLAAGRWKQERKPEGLLNMAKRYHQWRRS